MAQRYLPKIKVDTAKTIAKDLVANRSGGKISNEKFKQILRKDQDLRSYYYKPKNTSLTKFQTKKFIDKVVSTAKTTPGLKVSRLAQKLGFKPGATHAASDTILNKVYQKATQTQLDAQKPTGPSPEDISRQKRRDQMLKTLHKHERADEIMHDNKQQQAQQQQSSSKAGGTAPGVQIQHGGSSITGTSQANSSISNTGAAPARRAASSRRAVATDELKTLLIPVCNATPNAQGLESTVEKINKLLQQILTVGHGLSVLPPRAIHDALYSLRLDTPPPPDDMGTIAALTHAVQADCAVIGSVQRIGHMTNVSIRLVNAETKKSITLASIHDTTDDTFELERKIRWQVDHALSDTSSADSTSGSGSSLPSVDDAIDLPI
ncbi:MAG: hypothetical protein PHY34_05010 [Patescibacteria group bacterium]|nr:hypothetical protein [Patescibacteria group bacterium]MDD5715530.1 hypothetical protein [Patescibacteria group bacterium]